MSNSLRPIINNLRRIAVLAFTSLACARNIHVASETADAAALPNLKTFYLLPPLPAANRIAVAATNDSDRVAGAVMDLDPTLATSLVGRAMQKDITDEFVGRGYRYVDAAADFYVDYYAGTGRVVESRGSRKAYHKDGSKITTQTYEYPAGTIVIDVVNARSDSLIWRGIGVAQIPDDPNEYASAIRTTVEKIVESFPKAAR